MGGGLFLLVFIAIGAFVFANLVVAVVVTNLVSDCCFSTLIYIFITKALSFFYTSLPEFVPQWKLSCADTLGQASYQNGSHMRPLEVQKLDCRLRELAQLQINTGNAPPKKPVC